MGREGRKMPPPAQRGPDGRHMPHRGPDGRPMPPPPPPAYRGPMGGDDWKGEVQDQDDDLIKLEVRAFSGARDFEGVRGMEGGEGKYGRGGDDMKGENVDQEGDVDGVQIKMTISGRDFEGARAASRKGAAPPPPPPPPARRDHDGRPHDGRPRDEPRCKSFCHHPEVDRNNWMYIPDCQDCKDRMAEYAW